MMNQLKKWIRLVERTMVVEGITAYHGSPYNFDHFDLKQVNTGEGNQGQGHGLYFSTGVGTAEYYGGIQKKDGYVYKVNLNIDRNRMMDYSKPFEQQSPIVQKAIRAVADAHGIQVSGKLYGVKNAFAEHLTATAEMTAELRRLGVQGARYALFEMGRGMVDGYVIFDASLVHIVKKSAHVYDPDFMKRDLGS